MSTNQNYLIVTCDGGGIRGLLTALILQKLDQDLGILGKVNLFAGTSTGGILALGLASGVSIGDLVEMYENDGAQIFQPYDSSSHSEETLYMSDTEELLHAQGILNGLLDVKYNNTGLISVLKSEINPSNTLANLNSSVLVTALQLFNSSTNSWTPSLLTNLPGFTPDTSGTLVIDAALSTSAAPTYFPPYQGYADGGLVANNPCLLTYAALLASQALKNSNQTPANVRILSVGTGVVPEGINSALLKNPTSWGILKWLSPVANTPAPKTPLIAAMFDSSSAINTYQAQQILGNNFLRVDVPLSGPYALDDYQDISILETAVNNFVNPKNPAWAQIEEWVLQNFI